MLRKVALGFGFLKALQWLGRQLSNGITITAQPIQRGDIRLFDEKLRLRLVVTNRNDIPFTIKSVQGNITQAGQLLKSVNMQSVIKVNGGSTRTLLFEMQLDIDKTLMNLAEAIEQRQLLAPIVFKGKINVAGINLPVTRFFKFLKAA